MTDNSKDEEEDEEFPNEIPTALGNGYGEVFIFFKNEQHYIGLRQNHCGTPYIPISEKLYNLVKEQLMDASKVLGYD